MNGMNDFLAISNLSFSYSESDLAVINQVNIKIPQGSVTSLLGLNGSGKTTLLLLILGYLLPNSGKIEYFKNQERYSIQDLNGAVGYLPQQENIPFDYPVNDFIMLGRSPRIKLFNIPDDRDYEQVQLIQDFLGLGEFRNKKLHEISGGELQRVRIARTLSQEPSIILMDEPMTHLDIKHKQYISELQKELAKQGKIVIYSTHDPLDAIKNSDYCILLKKNMESFSGTSQVLGKSKIISKYFDMKIEIRNAESLIIHE
jgi:ABC-type cobalamin/Fe3+-siderophores transport system ATPase subunit